MSRSFAGYLGQGRNRCSNRCCCCSLRNYASELRQPDALAAGVESPSQTLAPGVVLCTATAGLNYTVKKYCNTVLAVRSRKVVIGTTREIFNFLTSYVVFFTYRKIFRLDVALFTIGLTLFGLATNALNVRNKNKNKNNNLRLPTSPQ